MGGRGWNERLGTGGGMRGERGTESVMLKDVYRVSGRDMAGWILGEGGPIGIHYTYTYRHSNLPLLPGIWTSPPSPHRLLHKVLQGRMGNEPYPPDTRDSTLRTRS